MDFKPVRSCGISVVFRGAAAAALSLALVLAMTAGSLAEPKVALVLGGGTARGYSHIGLLKAFEEEGIPVDYIVGTSMGSVVAGLYAAGFSADNLEYMVRHVNIDDLFLPAIPPRGGLFDTSRFRAFLEVLTDDAQFDDLAIPFYTVVLDLVGGEEVVLSQGSLSSAIIASMAIPGMFPPVPIDGVYYVDGGMRNLIPVGVARDIGADLALAVDIRREIDDINHETLTSNMQLALMLVLSRETDAALELADIVLTPDVSSDSYMDYDRGDHFVAEGYREGKARAPQIKAALLAMDPDFSFEPYQPGLPADEFASRLRAALNASEREAGGEALTANFALAVDSARTASTDFAASVQLARLSPSAPIFGSAALQGGAERSSQTIGLGAGLCRRTCASVVWRRLSDDPGWRIGAAVRGRLRSSMRYAGEWLPDSAAQNPTWRVSLVAPAEVQYNRGNEWRLAAQRDPQGMYGLPHETTRGEIAFRRYIPWNRADILEAVSATTSWYVGVGAQATLSDAAPQWSPMVELGIAFEGRLFGLYPLRSRLQLTYRGGDAAPWSLGLVVGER